MYLGYQNGQIKFYTEEPLDQELYNLEKIEETQDEYVLDGEQYVLKDEAWEQKQEQKEKERIQALSMTRSDFFDGTIKAFGADSEDLLVAIQSVLAQSDMTDVEEKVAINNYKNALNFYRKHPLFTVLSGVPIPIGLDEEGLPITITITDVQWDKFFDETNKKNPDAWKELFAITVEPEIMDDDPITETENTDDDGVTEGDVTMHDPYLDQVEDELDMVDEVEEDEPTA